MVPSRHHIRQGQQVGKLFIGEGLRFARHHNKRAIGVGHTQILRLTAQSLATEIAAMWAG